MHRTIAAAVSAVLLIAAAARADVRSWWASIPKDDAGFVDADALRPAGSVIWYVSSTRGDDARQGDKPDEPLKTIAAALLRVDAARGDWILLERGSVFMDQVVRYPSPGPASGMAVIGAYGRGPRPRIESATREQLDLRDFAAGASLQNLLITDLNLVLTPGDPTKNLPGNAVMIWRSCRNIVLQNLLLEGGQHPLVWHGHEERGFWTDNLVLSRVIVTRPQFRLAGGGGGSAMTFFGQVRGLLLEDCVLGQDAAGTRARHRIQHGVYGSASLSDVHYRRLLVRDASQGITVRTGGATITACLFLDCGAGVSSQQADPKGPVVIRNSAVLGSRDSTPAFAGLEPTPYGFGVFCPAASELIIDGLIVAGSTAGRANIPVHLDAVDRADIRGLWAIDYAPPKGSQPSGVVFVPAAACPPLTIRDAVVAVRDGLTDARLSLVQFDRASSESIGANLVASGNVVAGVKPTAWAWERTPGHDDAAPALALVATYTATSTLPGRPLGSPAQSRYWSMFFADAARQDRPGAGGAASWIRRLSPDHVINTVIRPALLPQGPRE